MRCEVHNEPPVRGLAESSAGRRAGAAETLNGSGTQNDCGVNTFIKRAENRQGRASTPRRKRDVHYVSQCLALKVGARRRRRNKRKTGKQKERERGRVRREDEQE